MSDKLEPTRIMLDGMDETPIAIPFPFKIGKYIISDPDEWSWFRQHYTELEALAADRLELLEEVLQWHRNYWDFEHLNRLIEKIDAEVVKAMAKESGDGI